MQHDFKHCYFGIYEEFEMLRCRLKRRARFLEAIAERNSPQASALEGFRGVATTLADVGNMLGEGVVSSAFRNSVYDQT
ncbi:hypothetical protein LEP1GSC166_1716, partial [Leptospira kirschneri]